jgi:hypothetical protein
VATPGQSRIEAAAIRAGAVRSHLANPAALAAARRRPMSERLELALSWNSVAAELRAGLAAGAAARESKPTR